MSEFIVNPSSVRRLEEVKTKELGRAVPTLKRGNRGMTRSRMPQIDEPADFVRWVKSECGIPYSMDHRLVGSLKPTQKHFNTEKVRGMAENARNGKFPKIDAPIVVSRDLRILDGHHRWAALRMMSPRNKIHTYTLPVSIEEVLKCARRYGARTEKLHKVASAAWRALLV